MAEKAPLVNQPDWRPTRKLFVSAVTGFVTLGVQSTVAKIAAGSVWFDWLGNDVALGAVPIMVGFGVGYLFRERSSGQARGQGPDDDSAGAAGDEGGAPFFHNGHLN